MYFRVLCQRSEIFTLFVILDSKKLLLPFFNHAATKKICSSLKVIKYVKKIISFASIENSSAKIIKTWKVSLLYL